MANDFRFLNCARWAACRPRFCSVLTAGRSPFLSHGRIAIMFEDHHLNRIKAEIADSFDEELEMQMEEDRLDELGYA